jgi:hypothetical protein
MNATPAADRLDAMSHLAIGLIMQLGKSRVIQGQDVLSLLTIAGDILKGDLDNFQALRARAEQAGSDRVAQRSGAARIGSPDPVPQAG